MTKWEYLFVEVLYKENLVHRINGKEIGEIKVFPPMYTGKPTVYKFLETVGQEGWEVIGLDHSSTGGVWHLILKRPIS